MKASEALEILEIDSGKNLTAIIVQKVFARMIKEHHPDHGGSHAMTLLLIAAREKLLETISKNEDWFQDLKASATNFNEIFQDIISKIQHLEGINIEVRGTWLWVSGQTKQYKNIFKENNFRWASKKLEWSWHLGKTKWFKGKKNMSTQDIRNKYGSEVIQTRRSEKLA